MIFDKQHLFGICYGPEKQETARETTEMQQNMEAKNDANNARNQALNNPKAGENSFQQLKQSRQYDKHKDINNLYQNTTIDIGTLKNINLDINGKQPERNKETQELTYTFRVDISPRMKRDTRDQIVGDQRKNIQAFITKFNIQGINQENLKQHLESAIKEIDHSADYLQEIGLLTKAESTKFKEGTITKEEINKIKSEISASDINNMNNIPSVISLKDGVDSGNGTLKKHIAMKNLLGDGGITRENKQIIKLVGKKVEPPKTEETQPATMVKIDQGFKQADIGLKEETREQINKLNDASKQLYFSVSVDSQAVNKSKQKVDNDYIQLKKQLEEMKPEEAKSILDGLKKKADQINIDEGNKTLLQNRALSAILQVLSTNSQQKIDVNNIAFTVNKYDPNLKDKADTNQRGVVVSNTKPSDNAIAGTGTGTTNKTT